MALFLVSIILHWVFGWHTFADGARDHGLTPHLTPYLALMGRDTFENWQSECLQLLWQVVGLAYFPYVGSPASKENDDRTEAKIDALLQLVGQERGEALIRQIDAAHDRPGGHASIHVDAPVGD